MTDAYDRFSAQVSESIKLVFDLTSRIDERVKIIVEKQNEMDQKFERVMDGISNLSTRVGIMESKNINEIAKQIDVVDRRLSIVETTTSSDQGKKDLDQAKKDMDGLKTRMGDLELKSEIFSLYKGQAESRWKMALDIFWKLVVAVAASFLIWKFGIKS